jgi:dTDP-4-dehydrorhamnose reductase
MRLALIGGSGMLAHMVAAVAPPHYDVFPFDLPQLDIGVRDQVLGAMGSLRPHVIVNCAAYTNVDACETQEELATRVNGTGAGHLAEAAREAGAVLVHISTDYVFDGSKKTPYTEEDPPNPLSAYGRSKLAGEEAIRDSGLLRYFILRTSWLYGPGGKNFVETIARLAGEREELRVVADQLGSPTYTEDLARAIFQLLALDTPGTTGLTPHEVYGIYHFANEGVCSWHAFAEAIVERLRQRGEANRLLRVVPISTEDYPLPAPRPPYSVFAKDRYRAATGQEIPDWMNALDRYFAFRGQQEVIHARH